MENYILTLMCIKNIRKNIIKSILTGKQNVKNDEYDILETIKLYSKNTYIPTIEDVKFAKFKADNIMHEYEKLGINILSIKNEKYPKKLLNIKNPPIMIFYKGNYNALVNKKSIAIVGSRKASLDGLKNSYRMGALFAKDKYSVISGLAKGCDEQAHRGCIDSNGVTVAVLPSSLEGIYPKSNIGLANDILINNGCLVSEYYDRDNLHKSNFVQRNRIQTGLSECLLVCENRQLSGTNHTINFALNQNRLLTCLDTNENRNTIKSKNCIFIKDMNDIYDIKSKINKLACSKDKIEKNDSLQLYFEI